MDSSLTQGTIITSLRSNQYPDNYCYGIVISARCDLANDKINKIFYLEAIKLEDWILSKKGFNILVNDVIKKDVTKLENILQRNGLNWETIKNFSIDEFDSVIDSEFSIKQQKENNDIKKLFRKYKKYTNASVSLCERKNLLSENRKIVTKIISNISNGQYTHFIYIPSDALDFAKNLKNGLIVDLQEVDYLNLETAKDLINYSIDSKSSDLSDEKKEHYNKKFFLSEKPGYSIMLGNIKSPWIEYLMQHFSNVFIRIGINNPSKEDINQLVTKIL